MNPPGTHDLEHDVELVRCLVRQWHTVRAWAEQLLVDALGLTAARDIMTRPRSERVGLIPGTPWRYRQHGVGIEITQPGNKGGIDFDFDQPVDAGWLRDFLIKQYNGGQLCKRSYRPLLQGQVRWQAAVAVWWRG